MGWLQVARITKDFVKHSGPKPIRAGEPIKVFAGTGTANSTAYVEQVESNFVRAAGVNPTTPLSDAYGLMIDDDPDQAEAARAGLSEEQKTVLDAYSSDAVVEEDTETPPPVAGEVPADCASLPVEPGGTGTGYPNDITLSANFTYFQLSKNAKAGSHIIRAGTKRGLTPPQQLCNLKALCDNVLEPLAAKYGRSNIQINSGYRNSGSAKSQHEIGQACDIRFLDLPTGRGDAAQRAYFERAKEIRAALNYDQLLLEVFGNQGPWIHISFKSTACRRDVKTFFSHTNWKPGLILVG
jgi:Peptidase M15